MLDFLSWQSNKVQDAPANASSVRCSAIGRSRQTYPPIGVGVRFVSGVERVLNFVWCQNACAWPYCWPGIFYGDQRCGYLSLVAAGGFENQRREIVNKMSVVVGLLVVGLLAGCATPTVTATKKTGDADLSCAQIKEELVLADGYLKEAKKDRTVTGTNVAAAILFWPALIGTYVNTEEAIEAAKGREAVLIKLAKKRKCKLEDGNEGDEVSADSQVEVKSVKVSVVADKVQTEPGKEVARMSVMELQKLLLSLGYPCGLADGAMGRKTIEAVSKFQKDHDLPVTGYADFATEIKLRELAKL